MIITIGNTKGGVGKTTLAVNVAIARALAGREVWLIDGDRQGTAQTAISIRSDSGHAPALHVHLIQMGQHYALRYNSRHQNSRILLLMRAAGIQQRFVRPWLYPMCFWSLFNLALMISSVAS